jgi:GTPase SAR1 family protein
MLSWMKRRGDSRSDQPEVFESFLDGLKQVYKTKLLPLETHYHFEDFHSSKLEDADFQAKPMVLLVGQYSTGKTSFIRYLLERDFPGIQIGPEPSTDSFVAVMHGDQERVIPGNALIADQKKQFTSLSKFGNSFLKRLQCVTLDSPILKGISIIDTPGILSGDKERVDRGYDFTGVLEWFAERADRIILFFDAHKPDVSDEFCRIMESFRVYSDKIRMVLNKADTMEHQQLMRVYGALMWSFGKVICTPEFPRVHVVSLWDQPFKFDGIREFVYFEILCQFNIHSYNLFFS